MRVDDNITVTSGSNFITVSVKITTQLRSQIRQQVKGNRTFRNGNKTKLLVYFKDRVISLITTNLKLTVVVSDSSPNFTVIKFNDLICFIWHTTVLRQCIVVSTRTDVFHCVTARSDLGTQEERSGSRSSYTTVCSSRQNRISNAVQLNKHVGLRTSL